MAMNKERQIMNFRTFDELLDVEYGKSGTPKRTEFENDTQLFYLATTLKEERLKAQSQTNTAIASRANRDEENLYLPSGERESRRVAQHPLPNF